MKDYSYWKSMHGSVTISKKELEEAKKSPHLLMDYVSKAARRNWRDYLIFRQRVVQRI